MDSRALIATKTNWLRIAFVGSLLTLIAHIVVLVLSDQSAVRTPISQLSRGGWGTLHTIGLVSFGCAHFALAIALAQLDRGRLWPFGRGLLVASGATLFYVAYYFSTAGDGTLSGQDANDPLWIVASLIGLAMGALQPGLARLSPRGLGLFSVICLGVWVWLIPVILLVNDSWLGAYERIVGAVYLTWMLGVSLGLLRISGKPG